jgi:UDP-glucose 4-epimerase
MVTGGSGFIGANFVRSALTSGHAITVFDDLSVGDRRYLTGLPVRFVQGSILNEDLVKSEVGRHEVVIHLAAQSGVPSSLADPRADCLINIIGTLNLLEACRATRTSAGYPRFVFASSNATLGRQSLPATEHKVPLPLSPYGASKLAGEAYCLAYHGSWGIETIALRFGNVYGPYSAHKKSVVARFCRDLAYSGSITLESDGLQTRDFIFVEDLCQALLKAVDSPVAGEVFQISSGTETSIVELANCITKIVGHELKVRHAAARSGEARRNLSDITKASRILGWEPKVRLEEGLRRTYEWHQSWNTAVDVGTACDQL